MKTNFLSTTVIIVSLFFVLNSGAQNLVISFKNGSGNSTALNQLQSVGFGQDNILLREKTGNVTSYSLSDIQKLSFSDEPVATTHTIVLSEGWNSLSSFVMPEETDIVSLFEPIGQQLIILQNLTQMYYPAGGINTIYSWDNQSAYSIKLSQDAILPITGQPEENKTILLNQGWNLMPVISSTSVNPETLFSGLATKLTIIIEVASSHVYWPAYNINTLGNLQPGKSYLVNMKSKGLITFP